MTVLVVGLSHRSAPVALLERAAATGDAQVKLLHDVYGLSCVAEALLLSTCNRVEVYASVDRFHAGVSAISELLSRHSGIPLEELATFLYVQYEDRAAQHVFSVACGLDSMVIGEGQILGQLRGAFKLAQDEGTVGRSLHELIRNALRSGKRAHTETGLDQAGASLVGVGLAVAAEYLGRLAGRRALVVGAGSMSGLAVASLARAGIGEIVVANRTPDRAQRLAAGARVPARAVPLTGLDAELDAADLVVSCTGAAGLVITADRLRPGRRRFFLDLALPHDVDTAVTAVPGVGRAGLEELRTAEEAAQAVGPRAVAAVRQIVAEEVARYLSATRAASVAPTVVALRSKAADVVEAELTRLTGRLPDLAARDQAEIAQAVRRVVDKLLHAPTVRVKELAAAPGGDTYATALRELFDLDPQAPEAVTRADMPPPDQDPNTEPENPS